MRNPQNRNKLIISKYRNGLPQNGTRIKTIAIRLISCYNPNVLKCPDKFRISGIENNCRTGGELSG